MTVKVRSCKHFFQVIYCTHYQRSSSAKGRLPLKVVFHQRSSSIKGRLPSKVVFHQTSSSIKGCLPSKVVLHQRSSSVELHLPPKAVFHGRLSSIEGRLPSKVHLMCSRPVEYQWLVSKPPLKLTATEGGKKPLIIGAQACVLPQNCQYY